MPIPSALEVAQQLLPRLLPLIPYLVKGLRKAAGHEFTQKLVKEGQKQAVRAAEKIWEKIKPKLDEDPAAREAVETVSQDPSNPENEQKLLEALQTALADPGLRKSIAAIMDTGKTKGASLRSYIEAGNIYGKVTGVEIEDLKSVRELRSEIKVRDVKKGGEIVGLRVGGDEPEEE